MIQLHNHQSPHATEALYSLACGPHMCCKKYSGCIANGVRFHTNTRDSLLKSQNSGVVVEGNHKDEIIDFYGVISEILELDYVKGRRVVLFKCKWFNLGTKGAGVKKERKLTSINASGTWYENDPLVLASQAKQVFYLNDIKLGKDWKIVQKFQHHHIFDVQELEVERLDIDDEDDFNIIYQENEANGIGVDIEDDDEEILISHRNDVDPDMVDGNEISKFFELDNFINNVDELSSDDDFDETLHEYISGEEEVEEEEDD